MAQTIAEGLNDNPDTDIKMFNFNKIFFSFYNTAGETGNCFLDLILT